MIISSVAAMQAIASPSSTIEYCLTELGKQGIFYYNASDTSTENIGTIISSVAGGCFKRVYPYNTVYASWFGAIGDGTTDCYDAIQNAINAVNGNGVVMLGTGVFYLNKYNAGALILPVNATGITIMGDGKKTTTLKLSRNVSRVFDFVSSANVASVNLYQNITIKQFDIDVNNIDGAAILPDTTVVTGGSGTSAWVTINVGSNNNFFPTGALFLPYTNTGTAAGNLRSYRLKAGSTSAIEVFLLSGESIAAGDTLQGACRQHTIIGMGALGVVSYNINVDTLNVSDIDVINVPLETIPSTLHFDKATTRRGAISIISNTSSSQGLGGYSGVVYAQNITVERVNMFGGAAGFAVIAASNGPEYFIDNIIFRDLYHTTNQLAPNAYSCQNFLIGNCGYGNRVLLERCIGEFSGDVGIEIDALFNAQVKDCLIKNAYTTGYYQTNQNAPAYTSAGAPKTTISSGSGIDNSSTALVIAAFPTNVANNGFLIMDSEVCYYNYSGSNTLFITRGLNSTAGVSHSDGTVVKFIEIDKQKICFENCRYENTQLTAQDEHKGWKAVRNGVYPGASMYIKNCTYLEIGRTFLSNGGAVTSQGFPNIYIDGLVINTVGINVTSGSGLGSAMYFTNSDYDTTNGANSLIPRTILNLKNIRINGDGILDTAGHNIYYGISIQHGNWDINWQDINIRHGLLSGSNIIGQNTGITIQAAGTFISGLINNYKFSSVGTKMPAGILMQNATIGSLLLDDLDFTDVKFDSPTTNAEYRPWFIDSSVTGANKICFGKIKHSIYASTQIAASKVLKRVAVTANYTVALTEDVLGVTTSSIAITITLPLVEAGPTNSKTNYGYQLIVTDETFTAATHNITITSASGEKINNSVSSYIISTNGGVVKLLSIPGGWIATANL